MVLFLFYFYFRQLAMSLHTAVSANINLCLLLVDGVHVFWVDLVHHRAFVCSLSGTFLFLRIEMWFRKCLLLR